MKDQIIEIIANYKGVDKSEIDAQAAFADMGLDSLDIAELAMQFEDACGVEIDLTPELNSIDKLVEYIEEKKNA